MYQKDYILFMIEQVARLLRRIVQRMLDGEYDDASYEIEQIYRQYLGINSDLIPSFSFESLMMLQSADPQNYEDRCLTLAELLRLEGEIFAKDGVYNDARGRFTKSLAIFLTILLAARAKPETLAEYHSRVDTLVAALHALPAPAEEVNNKAKGLPPAIETLLQKYRASQKDS